MPIIEDTNQKIGRHVLKNDYWESIGEKVVRCHLPFGDYCYVPNIIVDTKEDIYELASNIRNDHLRFKKAAILAKDCESQLVILTENTEGVTDLSRLCEWQESDKHFANRKRQMAKAGKNPAKAQRWLGTTLAKACKTMNKRYGIRFEFCTPEEAGQRVLDILNGG